MGRCGIGDCVSFIHIFCILCEYRIGLTAARTNRKLGLAVELPSVCMDCWETLRPLKENVIVSTIEKERGEPWQPHKS